MTELRISPDLSLPLDFATEGIVVMGVRGSGKSNTEVRFAEQLHENGIPFLAVDPKGDWYGIRMDGEKPGLPVPVFGGLYGDFPIDEHLGSRIADVLVDNNVSAVVDVSRMSHAARARFLTDLFKQLMERHQLEPHVRTVIFEEAHRYIPQQVSGPVAALKEAAASVLLEGRSFGLGCWACTQRPARLHNDVLEEVDTAIIHRIGVTATADLKRVRDWVKHEDLGDEIGQSLTKLKAGEAWVLSPVSLAIVQRVQMARRTTFDSGATPVVGDAKTTRRRLATMADIDAAAIKEALAETIEKAKADDPKELRKRIAALERHKCPEPAVVEPVRFEVPIVDDATRDAFMAAFDRLREDFDRALEIGQAVADLLGRVGDRDGRADVPRTRPASDRARPVERPRPAERPDPPVRREPRRPAVQRSAPAASNSDLTKPQQRVLDAVEWLHVVGFENPTKLQIGFIAGYRVGKKVGGTFGNVLGELRGAGLITYPTAGTAALTDTGHEQASPADIEMTTDGLQTAIFARLNDPERRVLDGIVATYPDPITKQDAGTQAGYTVGAKVGGTYGNILGRPAHPRPHRLPGTGSCRRHARPVPRAGLNP